MSDRSRFNDVDFSVGFDSVLCLATGFVSAFSCRSSFFSGTGSSFFRDGFVAGAGFGAAAFAGARGGRTPFLRFENNVSDSCQDVRQNSDTYLDIFVLDHTP